MQKLLGDYKIIKQIGHGSLGTVFLAEHRFIKKQFALKILPEELSSDTAFLKRFEEEVSKLAALDHPHIVKIHNVSSFDGAYFLVSDCIVDQNGDSLNLAEYMKEQKGRLKEEDLHTIATHIASALDYAHTKGQVVHRSLKLNNILINKGKNGIEAHVTDFGLAKIISPGRILARTLREVADALAALPADAKERFSPFSVEGENFSQLSRSFLQTFAFLAPEQKRSELVTLHVDNYAFGVLIYYLISGQFPEGVFPSPSQIALEYCYDWDTIVSNCLNQDFLQRPSQLLPLLEKIQTKRAEFVPHIESVREIESQDKEASVPLEKLKEKLNILKPLSEKALTAAASSFKPIIGHQIEEPLSLVPGSEVETSFVEGKDVSEATAPAITPQVDETLPQAVLGALLNRDPLVTQYQPEKKETKAIEAIPTEMIVIAGGEFMRGSNNGNRDEIPRHRIFLDPFALDIHPVTNEQFVRFLEYNGGEKDRNYHDLIRLKDSRINRSSGKLSIEPGYAKHPVVGVTWYGAFAYARWVGKRLPTEAEWEIASQGGLENSAYPTGDFIEKSQANFFSSDTTPVMSYPPNGYGIYDLVGNIYEWCMDWYGYNYYETSLQEPYNPKGPAQGVYRVLRGGCWKSLKEDLRCSHRHRNNPGTVNSTYGFRCAADVCKV